MPAKKHLRIESTNPNFRGGCLCSPDGRIVECKPPYIVFPHAMLRVHPHNQVPVVCLECAQHGVRKAAPPKQLKKDEPVAHPAPFDVDDFAAELGILKDKIMAAKTPVRTD